MSNTNDNKDGDCKDDDNGNGDGGNENLDNGKAQLLTLYRVTRDYTPSPILD